MRGQAEVAKMLLDTWDPLAIRTVDLLPESEHRHEAAEALRILAAGGGEAEIRAFLVSSELAAAIDLSFCARAAREVVEWFAEDQRWLDSLPPLVRSSALGDTAEVGRLLRSGVPPDTRREDSWSALHAAAAGGHRLVVALLLDRGGDVDLRDDDGFTALLNASGPCEDPEVIRLLLDAGADPDATDATFAWTPLSRAAEYCRTETIQLLLESGADPTHVEPSGFTPLMTAAESGCYRAIEMLLQAGSGPTLEFDGKRAADMARSRGFEDCADLLEGCE